MRREFLITTIFAFQLCLFVRAIAQEETVYQGEEVIVTASRAPTTFSKLIRSVTVVGQDEIKNAPVLSVQGLLDYVEGVDVRKRGPLGVQADISIRGGTFGQTLILIDGIKVIDPQTNHHNANLPLTLDDIERIEILKGPGSRLYGPNAFGGVVNIITKKSAEKRAHLKASMGEFGLYNSDLALSYPIGKSAQRLSLSKKNSDGYRNNTDFDISSVMYVSSIPVGTGEINFSAGHINNKFGANSFYVDPAKSDREWEHIKTTLVNVSASFKKNWLTYSTKLNWRKNKDHYIYNRENPSFYENFHSTQNYGGELSFTAISKLGMTSFGVEVGKEKLKSTRLDTVSRTKGGIFLEQHISPGKNVILVLGGFAYRYSDWGWKIWPGVDVGYQLLEGVNLYASVSQSFRIPTYTELSYYGPDNQGNPGLKPEDGWIYEAGINWKKKNLESKIAVFRRNGHNIIDWVRAANSTDFWKATMIGDVNTNGFEASWRMNLDGMFENSPISQAGMSYAFLDITKDLPNLESAYVLAHLRHQFSLHITHNWFNKLQQNWKLRYEKRSGNQGHFLVDTQIKCNLKSVALFIEATNLFDTQYVDLKSIPLPGRWIQFGFNFNLIKE